VRAKRASIQCFHSLAEEAEVRVHSRVRSHRPDPGAGPCRRLATAHDDSRPAVWSHAFCRTSCWLPSGLVRAVRSCRCRPNVHMVPAASAGRTRPTLRREVDRFDRVRRRRLAFRRRFVERLRIGVIHPLAPHPTLSGGWVLVARRSNFW
jgi:hypothetical protein